MTQGQHAVSGEDAPVGVALLFPGQGSQYVGMGDDLGEFPRARLLFEQADEILHMPLSRLCSQGPEDSLNDTANTQPAIFVTSLALREALLAEGRLPRASAVAGHSLGELTALAAAGAISFADGLLLTRERGRLMRDAGEHAPGGMAAVLKMDDSEVEEACQLARSETGQPVQIANHNAPGQVVISGHRQALDRAVEILRARGAKRIVPLAVSIAAHSPLMATAAADYTRAVEATPVHPPQVPLIGNVSARPITSPGEIGRELVLQLTCPVQWTASVRWMADHGITRFVEIGPKDVLSRLVERIVPGAEVRCVGDSASVRSLVM